MKHLAYSLAQTSKCWNDAQPRPTRMTLSNNNDNDDGGRNKWEKPDIHIVEKKKETKMC